MMRVDDEIKGKRLRCLHEAQPTAVKRFDDALVLIDFLHGVGDRNGGNRRAVFCRRVDRARDQGAGQERPGGVVDEDEVRLCRAECFQSGANRSLPCGAAPNRRQALEAGGRRAKCFSVARVFTGLYGVGPRMTE